MADRLTAPSRRRLLEKGVACAAAALFPNAAPAGAVRHPEAGSVAGPSIVGALAASSAAIASLHPPVPIARLHASAAGSLFAIAATGDVWEHVDVTWRPIGTGADPTVEPATGHGRLATRGRDGRLWIAQREHPGSTDGPMLARDAGLLVLADAVIGVAPDERGQHVLLRMEADHRGRWRETARSVDAVLPDARPVRWNPDCTSSDRSADIAVLGGPDATRYRHAVLGDDIEATTLLRLERHGLAVRGRLDLPPPHVFEDIAPRPITWQGRPALLTVRAGPLGGQLVVVVADAGSPGGLSLAASGPPIGQRHRWLAPITDGARILAVHTPHIGGVLHRYRSEAGSLVAEAIARGVSNHALGARELDVSAWLGELLVIPTQDWRGLRMLDTGRQRNDSVLRENRLESRVVTLHRWMRPGEPVAVALLSDGDVVSITTPR